MRLHIRRYSLALIAACVGLPSAYQQGVPIAPVPATAWSSSILWWACAKPSQASRTSGAYMWLPLWRAPATVDTKADHERRGMPIMSSLWVFVQRTATLPIRAGYAVGRALRSVCLHISRPWTRKYHADARAPAPSAPRGSGSGAPPPQGWAPSAKQAEVRERQIMSLVRLDTEGVLGKFMKLLLDPTATLSDPAQLPSYAVRSLEDRSPLLQWHIKHNSPAGWLQTSRTAYRMAAVLRTGGRELQSALATGTHPHLADKRRELADKRRQVRAGAKYAGANSAAYAATPRPSLKNSGDADKAVATRGEKGAAGGRAPAAAGGAALERSGPKGKGQELAMALRPIAEINLPLVMDAMRRNPAAAPGISLQAAHMLSLLALWRASTLVGASPARRWALMNAFLCKVALTVATCRAQVDPSACSEGSACREVLDGDTCVVPDDSS